MDLDDEPYTAPQPALDRDKVRREHAEWSQATFGDVGPVGPLKHLSKEALEAATEPDDLSEWADMQFLLWDAQRRAGITDEQITQAMIEKLAVNKQREWPAPKDGEPRLHIKEQPAPVAYGDFEEFWSAYTHPLAQDDELKDFAWDIWNAATLQAGTLANEGTIQAGNSPVIPDGWKMVPIDATRAMIDAAMRAEEDGYDAMHKAMLAAAPQEVPDGQR
ncbi:DUF550 domain-containing protein [Raoultella sp. Lac2]|nr:DUF550 domain-containing protein [Raoultella sp. Lac2]MXF99351.1 DUF550 domain-containing protein [Raoultella sp. Lac1]